jgi:hypothetical protein
MSTSSKILSIKDIHICPKFKKSLITFGCLLPILYAIVTLFFKIWQLNKGIVMSDEAWYLLLMKDLPHGMASNFHLYFKNIFQNDIYSIRVFAIVLSIIGSLVYSYGIYVFFKKQLNFTRKNFYIIWSFSFILLFGGIYTLWICYLTLNHFIIFVAGGFILIAFKSDRKWAANLYTFLSGLFLGSLFFIMITNVPIILFFPLFIYLFDRTRFFSNSICLTFGIIFSIIIYFLFVEDFNSYFRGFISLFTETTFGTTINNDPRIGRGHGIMSLFYWLKDTTIYLIQKVFVATLILWGLVLIISEKQLHIIIKIVFIMIFIIYCKLNWNSNFISQPYRFPSPIPFFASYICLLLLILTKKYVISIKNYLFFGFIFIIPILLTFGTDLRFKWRSVSYLQFLLPIMYIMIEYIKENKNKFWFAFLLLVSVYFFYSIYLYRCDRFAWFKIVYTKQTESIQSLGIKQRIFIDEQKYDLLKEVKGVVNQGDYVIIGDFDIWLWGVVYLLDLKPITYKYFFDEADALKKLKEKSFTVDSFKCISSKNSPIDSLFIDRLQKELEADTIIKRELKEVTVYSFKYLNK